MIKQIVSFSGGLGSFYAAERRGVNLSEDDAYYKKYYERGNTPVGAIDDIETDD